MNDQARHARHAPTAHDAEALMLSLLHGARALGARLDHALAAAGTSLAKHGVLTALVEAAEPVPLGGMAERLQCVRSNITQLMDRLEGEGLVRRVDDPRDRRSVRAELTPEGRARQAAGATIIEDVAAGFGATLPSSDRAALHRLLATLG